MRQFLQKVCPALQYLQTPDTAQERSDEGSQDQSSRSGLSRQLLQVRGLQPGPQLRYQGQGVLAHQTPPSLLPVSLTSVIVPSLPYLVLQVLQEETE